MSLAITVISPEGVVVGADSRLTLTTKNQNGNMVYETQNYFDNAVKVLNLKAPHDYVVAVTFGAGSIGKRTAHSFLKEFQATLPPRRLSVKTYAKKILDFYKEQWNQVEGHDPDSKLYFHVAGINASRIYGEAYVVTVPDDTEPQPLIQHENYSIAWGGQTEMVYRLVKGYDPGILVEIQQSGLPDPLKQAVEYSLNSKELNLPVQFYSLQDCIDLVRFLINTTTDAQNLTVGVRGVGGLIDIGCITRDKEFRFISRKELK